MGKRKEGGYTALQTTLLYMNILNKDKSLILFFYVFFISKGNLLDFFMSFGLSGDHSKENVISCTGILRS